MRLMPPNHNLREAKGGGLTPLNTLLREAKGRGLTPVIHLSGRLGRGVYTCYTPFGEARKEGYSLLYTPRGG